MLDANSTEITDFLNRWHEAHRETWSRNFGPRTEYPNAPGYDQQRPKSAKTGRKWINLDDARSAVMMVDRETQQVFGVKAYGVPNLKKYLGQLNDMFRGEIRDSYNQKILVKSA